MTISYFVFVIEVGFTVVLLSRAFFGFLFLKEKWRQKTDVPRRRQKDSVAVECNNLIAVLNSMKASINSGSNLLQELVS